MKTRLYALAIIALALLAPHALHAQMTTTVVPANNAVGIDPTKAGLSWQPINDNYLYYEVKLQPVGGDPVVIQVMVPPVVFDNLQPNTIYIWYLGVVDANGETWLGPWSFQTAAGALTAPVEPTVVYDVPSTVYYIDLDDGFTYYYHAGHPHPNDHEVEHHRPWWDICINFNTHWSLGAHHPAPPDNNPPHNPPHDTHPGTVTPPDHGTPASGTTTTTNTDTTTHSSGGGLLKRMLTIPSWMKHNNSSSISSSSDNSNPSNSGNSSKPSNSGNNSKPSDNGGSSKPSDSGSSGGSGASSSGGGSGSGGGGGTGGWHHG